MKIWHLTLSSVGRSVLFTHENALRAAVHCIVRVAAGCVVLFCIVDDHVHIVVMCVAARRRWLRTALVQALSALSGQRLVSHVTPVESRAHLNRLVRYLLGQTGRHGLDAHAAWWSGSCYQDLVGARCVVPLGAQLRIVLPRLRTEELHRIVGLPADRLVPAGNDAVRIAGPDRLVLASAAAVAAGPELRGRTAPVVAARRTCVHLAETAGIPRSELVRVLRQTRQRVCQLATEPADPACLHAARLQLTLEDLLRAARPSRAMVG